MEHEHRNGSTPLGGLSAENGHPDGNGQAPAQENGASQGPSAGNGHAHSNGQSLYARKLEYADRSVANGAIDRTEHDVADATEAEATRRCAVSQGPRQMQQVGEARRRQGLSVRCVAQRLGMTVGEVRAQEESHADMMLSELYRWQSVLDVPLEELLADPQDALSPRVLMRARMLRVMKTARALRAQARSEAEHRLAKLLISQLIEIMPELKEVAAWPTVGHRRTADEVGRIGERPIPDDFMNEAS